MRKSLLIVSLLLTTVFAWAQSDNIWSIEDVETLQIFPEQVVHDFATDFRLYRLDEANIATQLLTNNKRISELLLPLPDGSNVQVQISPSNDMAPGLAARYPGIRTYRILPKGKIHGGVVGWTHLGLYASLRTNQGTFYIDPYIIGQTDYYTVYNVQKNLTAHNDELAGFECGVTGTQGLDPSKVFSPLHELEYKDRNKDLLGESIVQRKYRLAMATTGEFSQFYASEANTDPSIEISLSAVVAIVARCNDVLGIDLAVQFELVENNDLLIGLNPDEDAFDDFNTGALLGEVDAFIDRTIGATSFDVGHVIGVGPANVGQGVASLQSICTANKGSGVSTRRNPIGDPFIINILLHEIGHQMGATHITSSCQNVEPSTAVEPGGGSTIMGYAGICPTGNNLQTNADPYFNTVSLQQIFNYMREGNGNACGERIEEGNTIPDITDNYEDGFFIPISTPFELVAEGSDMEGDDLTYTWEQIDRNLSQQTPPGFPEGNSPLFRSVIPSENPNRVFPRMSRIVNNTTNNFIDEVLPTYSRDLTFRCTVRDNHPTSGGASWTSVAFASTDSAGPFRVTSPNTADVSWEVGDYVEVNWDVANTDNDLVDCQRVNIRLSTDGGFTYPITLLENTANDGSAFVTVPDAVSSEARIRVDAANNVFFDISNRDFSIGPATEPGYTVNYGPQYQKICIPQEEATINFSTGAVLGFAEALNFEIISELPEGVEASFSANNLTPGGSTNLNLNFENSSFDGLFTVEVRTIAMNQDTTIRDFDIETVNNDFSSFALLAPVLGERGIIVSTDFSWTEQANADNYDFQLATSADFAEESLIDIATDVNGGAYTPTGLQLEESTLYFWRVRPKNECGAADWSIPFVFQTALSSCEELSAPGLPISIRNSGPLVSVRSPIDVTFSGNINDVNIPLLDIRYGTQFYSLKLIGPSPNPQEVLLYEDGFCFDGNRLNIGFDSDSPLRLNCEEGNEPMLSDQTTRQPIESLDAFNSTNTQGEWTLELKLAQNGFNPGTLESWSIEFCADVESQQLALLENDTLFVPPGQANPISNELLSIEDTQQSQESDQFLYTLVTVPRNGELTNFFGETLEVGSTFTQASIDALNIRYRHDDSNTIEDDFYFVVQDGTGAFWPTERFIISIDDRAIVNTDDLGALEQELRLFPNPTAAITTLQLSQTLDYDLPLRVYDLQGRFVLQAVLPQGNLQQQIDVSTWPAGTYILQAEKQSLRFVVE